MSKKLEIFEFAFRAYGVSISVSSNDSNDVDGFRRQLKSNFPTTPEALRNGTAEHRFLLVRNPDGKDVLYQNSRVVGNKITGEDLLLSMISLVRLTVAEFARDLVFVHAGVVGWNGKAIVFPGKSLTGKTTLTAELVRAGADYYSDEYAVFDSSGFVHPYPKPLSVRLSVNDREQTDRDVSFYGGKAGTKPIPVGLILITQYSVDAFWKPVRRTPGNGVLALAANAVSIRTSPAFALSVLSQACRNSTVIESKRPDMTQIADEISNIFDRLSENGSK